jgi:hypothetical protein
MNFETYINQAWNDHANQSEKVAQEFTNAFPLVETNDQIVQLTGLITHVMGEHLWQWENGISLLESLKDHSKYSPVSESERSILRSLAVLKIGGAQPVDLRSFSLSDQIRVMAAAASALSGRGADRAKSLLQRALDLANSGLDKEDPANRALAITGNNLACALEEKSDRSLMESELMILAAQTGRLYWEVAGTWLEVSRAEYRLAMTYVKAGDFTKAFRHAQTCVELCQENKAGDLDMFFGYEALAVVERAKGNQIGFQKAVAQAKHYFEKLPAEDKSWCEASLKKILAMAAD